MNNSSVAIRERIKSEMAIREWTPKDLERATYDAGAEVERHKIRRILLGETVKVCVDDAVAIADTLEIPLDEFFRGPEWREPLLPEVAECV